MGTDRDVIGALCVIAHEESDIRNKSAIMLLEDLRTLQVMDSVRYAIFKRGCWQ